MKISLNWIKKFVDIPRKYTAKQLAELLTLRTCEVEGFEDQTKKFENMVIGEIKRIRPHPQASKLKLCDTDIGDTLVQIVCGGTNVKEGMLVPVALPGAKVDWHGKGEFVTLEEATIRGEKSYGMICAGEEVGLPKCEAGEITDLSYIRKETARLLVKPGTPLAHALWLDDVIFEIDNKSLTHRPDLWGHYGMAREFATFLSQKLRPYEEAAGIGKLKIPAKGESITIKIESEKISPRFCAAIVTGVKIEESPEWLKTQLAACGIRPINNVVDITNFVMLELGQPMHAFDRKVVGTDCFEIRYAKDGEILETLDHKKRVLTHGDSVISNGRELLALAGIMGGLKSEISEKTTEIIFEAANWNPVMIRKTSQRLGLRSEASQRYEKSLDPKLSDLAIKRACSLLLGLCESAKLAGPMADEKLLSRKSIMVKLSPERAVSKIGVEIVPKDMKRFLETLGFAVSLGKKEITVEVPSYRATKDISIEDDLVEEIARLYGYEKIPSKLPAFPIKLPPENRERKLKHWARKILSLSLGFTELSHYSFYKEADLKACLLPENVHYRVSNPLSEEQTHLRASLVPNLLKSIVQNERMFPEMKVYEIGHQYGKRESYFPLEEKYMVGAVVKERPSGKQRDPQIFYEIKGVIEVFAKIFPLQNISFEESKTPPPYAQPKKCAEIFVSAKEKMSLGFVFELHPLVKQNFDIRGVVGMFSINFSLLASLGPSQISYRAIPKFPGIDLDVSLIADRRTRNLDVESIIQKTDATLIKDVRLIDMFEGEVFGPEKKSLTYRIHLESPERTLTDEDMHQVQEKVFRSLEREGFQVRK